MRAPLTIWSLLVLSSTAFASPAMLMIDMNYSQDEYRILKGIAEKNGEDFYVVPDLNLNPGASQVEAAEQALLSRIIAQGVPKDTAENVLSGIIDSKYAGYLIGHEAAVAAVKADADRYQALRDSVIAAESKVPPLSGQIASALQQIASKGEKLEDLVISGHSDGTSFFSDTSLSLSSDELDSVKKQNPNFANDPKHVLLLGCYSNTEMAHKNWRLFFPPSVELVAGFSKRSPSGSSPLDHKYIVDMLDAASQVDAAPGLSADAIKTIFTSKKGYQENSAAIDFAGNYFSQSGNLSCDEQWSEFYRWSQHFDIYNQYAGYYQHPPLQDPPRATDGTPIRDFYTSIQQLCDISESHAYGSDSSNRAYWNGTRLSLRDSLLRIIFWWNIEACFANYHRNDIADFQGFLDKRGIELKIPDLNGNTGRIAYVQFYTSLYEAIESKAGVSKSKTDPIKTDEERKALDDRALQGLDATSDQMKFFTSLYDLYYLNSNIPGNWAEMQPSTVQSHN